jgi:hypothetical protein
VRPGTGPRRKQSLRDSWQAKQLAAAPDGVVTPLQPSPRGPRAGRLATVTKLPPRPVEAEEVTRHFPPDISALIKQRPVIYLGGHHCELRDFASVECWGRIEAHHRVGKGMGGCTDPALHVAANGLAVCQAHHTWIHNNIERCRPLGLALLRGTNFYAVPVSFDGGRTRRWLTDAGAYKSRNPLGGDAA